MVVLLIVVVLVVAQEEEQDEPKKSSLENFKSFLEEIIRPHMKDMLRFVIEADVSADCQVHLARFGQGVRNAEPWTSRCEYNKLLK